MTITIRTAGDLWKSLDLLVKGEDIQFYAGTPEARSASTRVIQALGCMPRARFPDLARAMSGLIARVALDFDILRSDVVNMPIVEFADKICFVDYQCV